jgi:hypothetical protein
MKRIIKITESHLDRIIKTMLTEENNLIDESVSLSGAKVIPVPINWKGPYGKFSGQLKIVKDNKEIFYKLTVDHWAYSGPILVEKLWKSDKDGDYKVVDSTGKTFSVSLKEMKKIVANAIAEMNTFTIHGGAKVTFDKTS